MSGSNAYILIKKNPFWKMAHFFINNLLIVKFLKDLKLVNNKLKKFHLLIKKN